ncbi:MAG: SPOR domain-containing protein [Bacteroidetes bacterium]|nr:MAG: SPOR domain-containing protein [Bacteroidota bacterium]
MLRLFSLIIGTLVLCTGSLLAQAAINVSADPIIEEMIEQFTINNKAQSTVPGWRVQILATTDRQRLESVMQSFKYHYPNIPVDWEHDRPYYKLQAGAFKTKLDALRLKHILSREYEGLYLVRDDKINKNELLNYF